MVDSTISRCFYKPKREDTCLHLSWNLTASNMIALFPIVFDTAVSKVWTHLSWTQTAVRASTCEMTAPLYFNNAIFPAVCCVQGTAASTWQRGENGIVNVSPESSHGLWMNATQDEQHRKMKWKGDGVMVASNTDIYLHPSFWTLQFSEVGVKLHLDC